jgi:hypothetical protein
MARAHIGLRHQEILSDLIDYHKWTRYIVEQPSPFHKAALDDIAFCNQDMPQIHLFDVLMRYTRAVR